MNSLKLRRDGIKKLVLAYKIGNKPMKLEFILKDLDKCIEDYTGKPILV